MNFKQYFDKEKEFQGILLDESGQKIYNLECELIYNEYKPEEIILNSILFDKEGNHRSGINIFKKFRGESLQILTELINDRYKYFFDVSVKRATLNEIIFSAKYFFRYEDEIIDYKMRHSLFNPDELDHSRLFFVWYLHQFKEQGMAFNPLKHHNRGLVFGYEVDIDKDFEEGTWKKNSVEIQSDEGKITFEPNMFIKEIESEDRKSYYVLPELSGRIEYKCENFPEDWNEIKKRLERMNEKFNPVLYALRFITGSKIDSFSQSLFYYNLKTKRYSSDKKESRD